MTIPVGSQNQIMVKGLTDWETTDIDFVTMQLSSSVALGVKNDGIQSGQLSTITAANKISGAALYNLANTPSGAGQIPLANLDNAPIRGAKFSSTTVFTINDTTPVAYEDLDLSAVTGAIRCLAVLFVYNDDASLTSKVWFRPNGSANDITDPAGNTTLGGGITAATILADQYATIVVPTDTAGIVEWKESGVTDMTILVRGWIPLA